MSNFKKVLEILRESKEPFVLYYDKKSKNAIKIVNKFKKDSYVNEYTKFNKDGSFESSLDGKHIQRILNEIADEMGLIDNIVKVGYNSGKDI